MLELSRNKQPRGQEAHARGTQRGIIMNNNTTVGEVLQDINNKGKERPWVAKKVKTMIVSEDFAGLKEVNRADRLASCCSWLKFAECNKDGYKKLIGANFCRDRMCPMCNWRRSRKMAGQISMVLHEAAEREPKMKFIFVTLTVKNCKGEDLDKAIGDMLKGFDKMMKSARVNNICLGFARNLEVTYNRKANTYHPHIHMLMGVKPSYFGGREYINQAEWTSLWWDACKMDYKPVVNTKAVKATADKSMAKTAAEVGKYSVKDSDYGFEDDRKLSMQVLFYLSSALKGRRLIGYGKLFAKVHKELHLQDIESDNADLVGKVDSECTCPICNSNLFEVLYKWNYGFNAFLSVGE
jgi:plasmid rolling circle replication initiator protein Rep